MQTIVTNLIRVTQKYGLWVCCVGATIAALVACRPEDESKLVPENRKGNILNELSARLEFSSFVQAVNKTGYKNAIGGAGGLYTVFAPDNQAVQSFLTANGYTSLEDIPLAMLNKFLGNHFIPSSMLYPADLASRKFNPRLDNRYRTSGDKFLTILYTDPDNITVNGAQISSTPTASGNGVFYQVDEFLVPQRSADSLWQTSPNYSLFYQLVKRFRFVQFDPTIRPNPIFNPITNQIDSIKTVFSRLAWNPASDEQVITFLAPTDAAMSDYLAANGYASPDDIPEATAKRLVESHILPPPNLNTYLKPRSKADFVEGVVFNTPSGKLTVGTDLLASEIVEPDILVSNGILHGISKVLFLQ